MIKPRKYQLEAVKALSNSFASGKKKSLIVASTGAGKSVMIALIVKQSIEKSPDRRVLILCHQAEILGQNEKMINLVCNVETGIYCASMGRKETTKQVILASRDSLARNPLICGDFDLVISDESHMINDKKGTSYQKIFDALNYKWLAGFTATPWRMNNKIFGEGAFFEEIAYNIGLEKLQKEGFLCNHSFPKLKAEIKTEDVKITAGDFNIKSLDVVSTSKIVVDNCVDRWHELASERKCTIFFCCSIKHAEAVVESFKRYLEPQYIGYIDGSSKNREAFFEKARAGKFKVLVNVMVLSVGIDIPIIDCVYLARPTLSPSLFIQAVGRGLRLAPDKKDTLIIDVAGNFDRFESLANPMIKEPTKKGKKNKYMVVEKAPKECPSCKAQIAPAARHCGFCGELFLTIEDVYLENQKSRSEVISQKHWPSVTNKGQKCYVVEVELANGKKIRNWLLHLRKDWIGLRAKGILKKLSDGEKIIWVKTAKKGAFTNIKEYGWL